MICINYKLIHSYTTYCQYNDQINGWYFPSLGIILEFEQYIIYLTKTKAHSCFLVVLLRVRESKDGALQPWHHCYSSTRLSQHSPPSYTSFIKWAMVFGDIPILFLVSFHEIIQFKFGRNSVQFVFFVYIYGNMCCIMCIS